MEEIFEIIEEEEGEATVLRIGLRLSLAGRAITCPVSGTCRSLREFEAEAEAVREGLGGLVARARAVFEGTSFSGAPEMGPDMSPEAIWSVLSAVSDEAAFVQGFNGLEETTRKAVAEYVLTRCNVFAGKASLFSSRYDSAAGLIE